MDDAARTEIQAAAFDQAPLPMALTEGHDRRLVALNRCARMLYGDQPLGEPIGRWLDTGAGEPISASVALADGHERAVLLLGAEVVEAAEPPDDLVVQVQDALLPDGLPIAQGAVVSARYALADASACAGGDWFDASLLPDGRLVLSVGDVVGHGIGASATMGELRTVLDDRVRDTGDLGVALEALDRHARRVPEARATTLCAAVLDPATGDLRYCTAGHPPPVLVRDGSAIFLPTSGSSPLCVDGAGYEPRSERLEPGDLVLLYSDGLVQRPGRSPAQNTLDLLHTVEAAVGTVDAEAAGEPVVDRVCRRTLDLVTRTGFDDDITVLAVQRTEAVRPLRAILPASAAAVGEARRALAAWLTDLQVSVLDEMSLQHAVGELVTNAVEHGSGRSRDQGHVQLSARLRTDGSLAIEVADDGGWRGVEGRAGGRGLRLARGLVDRLELERDDGGTVARLHHRPLRPVELLRGGPAVPTADARVHGCALQVDDSSVACAGAVDTEGAYRLARAIEEASRSGLRPVTVDLAEVDLLSSAAVQVLVDARAAAEVVLVAPAGSPAQHVLELVHLPYDG